MTLAHGDYKKEVTILDNYSEKIVDVNEAVEEEVKEHENESLQDSVEEIRRVPAMVIDCHRLNIRERPTTYSRVIATVAIGTKLEIIDRKKAGNFYKVVLPNGIEGFCMKDFVKIIS